MKLDYYDLLHPKPIYMDRVGGFVSPYLRDINNLAEYYTMLNMLLMKPSDYWNLIPEEDSPTKDNKEKRQLPVFDLLIQHNTDVQKSILSVIEKAFNFFMTDYVKFDPVRQVFLTYKDKKTEIPCGIIYRDNYLEVCDLIAQRNYIRQDEVLNPQKTKNKKALSIMQKIEKGRADKKTAVENRDYELGNIISKVASKHPSINMLNIYDLTIFQLYDQFYNLISQSVFDIQGTAVAFNGSSAIPDFNYTNWFHNNSTQ